ncbi:hypothetical protein EB73_32110 [Mycobacterium sp. SWH-M3]|nr:hypothetical protein EB73_32110 [Mycobacterium sp. SWH-M3]
MGDRTLFPCPVHGDTVPTVTVRFNPVSRLVDIGCTVGCNPAEILDAVGLSLADLASDDSSNSLLNNEFPVPVRSAPAAGTYTYLSASGERLGQVVYDGTQAAPRLRKWNPATSRWANGDFGPALYRLPDITAAVDAAEPVWLVGDEAAAHLIDDHHAVASCALGGWDEFGIDHVGRIGPSARVIVVADRSQSGYRTAARVRDLFAAAAPSVNVTVVEPATGIDLGQHFAAGRTLNDFVAVDPASQLTAPADPTAPITAPAGPSLSVAPPPQRRGGRGGGDDDETPNRAAVYVHRHGQTVQVRTTRPRGSDTAHRWYEVVWTCEVRVRKITYQDLADAPGAPRIPGSWQIELRRRIVDESGHYVSDANSIDGFAYETATATIAAEDFHTPGWPDLLPWAGVIANETPNGRAKARAAAIAVSGIRSTTPAFAATGWRESNGSAIYVHPGGAIGDSGELMGDVTLDLPARFGPMAMASPVPVHDSQLLSHAVEHGLDPLIATLPGEIASPIIGYAFRTFLGKPRGSVHLMGAPGTGKTTVARVCGMSWTSTAFHEHGHTSLFTGGDKMDDSMRALAMLMHSAKDALILVDEFKGRTAQERVNALHTLFWNGAERSVSTTRGQIRRSSGPPRCGLVTTGEVGSVGSSATRTLTLAVNRDVVADPVTVWSQLESAGARSWRAQLGASFVQWLAADHEKKIAAAQRYATDRATAAWQQFSASLPHTDGLAGRLIAIASDITVGWAALLQCLLDREAITPERADRIWQWAMEGLAVQLRAQDHSVGDGAEQLLTLVREAMTSGAGHATDRSSGEAPAPGLDGPAHESEVARAFGWVSRGPRTESGAQNWSPRGNHLGVVDSTEQMLYLFPRETLATMASLTARVGEHFTATTATITSSLGRRGWLGLEGDGTRRTRIRIAGVLTSVWPVPLSAFYGDDQPGASSGSTSGPRYPVPPWRTRPQIVPALDLDGVGVDRDAHSAEGRGQDPMTQEMFDFGPAIPALTVVHDDPADDDSAADAADTVDADSADNDSADNELPDDAEPAGEDRTTGENDTTIEALADAEDLLDDTVDAEIIVDEGDETTADAQPAEDVRVEGESAPAPVALRPLVSAGGGDQRWLYAAATVTATALVLPDGESIPISIGPDGDVKHLGDLVELAAALHLGYGGGRSLPEPPQLILTAEALAQFGVILPPVTELVQAPDQFAPISAAGAALMKATLSAGYQTSKVGTLRIWTKIWKDKKAAEFVLLPAVEVVDPHSELLTGDVEPVDLAYRLHRMAELLGTTYSTSGAITGRRLYERLHPPGGRALTPTEIVMPPDPFTNPRRMAAGTMMWIRPFTAEERRHKYIHGYDLRANYLTAAGKAIVGMGAPEHHPDGIDFNPKTYGLWRISRSDQFYPGFIETRGGHTMLPDIMELAGRGDYDTGWYPTIVLKYLAAELEYDVQVQEAYTWSVSRRLLEAWAKHVNSSRQSVLEHLDQHPADTNGRALRKGNKAIYTGFIGRLAYGGDCDDRGVPLTPWHRPDWRWDIQAEANVDLHRKIRRIAETTGRYPVAVLTDELLYTSDDPNPVSAKPSAKAPNPDPMPLGIGLGQWDVTRTHEITDELIAKAEARKLAEFNLLIPKAD